MCGAQTRCPGAASAPRAPARPPASVVAIGFSTSTCLPASSAARASRPCSVMLVSTSTTSTSGCAADGDVVGQVGRQVEPLGAAGASRGRRRRPPRPRRGPGRAGARSGSCTASRRRCRSRRRRGGCSRRAPRGLVVRVGPGRAVDVVAGGERQLRGQRGGGRQRGDRREPRVAPRRPAAAASPRRPPRTGAPPRRRAGRPPGRATPSGGRGRGRTSPTSRPRGSRRPRPGCARSP